MDSNPSSTLRERGKARRHGEIVVAAADLWRERGFENVSLNQIAAAAEVAPQTIYNLIGGLDAIGFAVVKIALDQLDAALAASPSKGVTRALEASRISAELYVADARLYRQVLVRIPQVLFNGVHLGRDVAQITIDAMTQAQAEGEIVDSIAPERLGRAIYANYLGALYDWACGDTTDAGFRRAAEIAVLAPVAACAADGVRPALTARLFAALGSRGS